MGEFDPAPGAAVAPPDDEFAPAAGAPVVQPGRARANPRDPTQGIEDEPVELQAPTGPAALLARVSAKIAQSGPAVAAGYTNAVPFGLGPKVAGAAARAAGAPVTQKQIGQAADQVSAQNPRAALAGTAARFAAELPIGAGAEEAAAYGLGKILPGVASTVARAAKAAPALTAAAKGGAIGAGYGAATSAGQAASQGDDVGAAALRGAEAGGVGGAVLGGVAAKAAPVMAKALNSLGEGAEARQIARTREALELKVNKGTRAGLKSDVVDTAIADNPALQKAAGNDTKVAEVTASIKGKAAATLKPIYQAAGPADEAAAKAVSNVDARIDELKKGDVNAAAAAKKLQALRDEFNNRLGERAEVSATDLRAEQSAYQKNGYAKNINADPDVAAGILAQREMSKAVGDAVVEHVTGMNYQAASAAAAADPESLAARLFKANDQINAANKIEAGIADRAGRVKPKEGLLKIASEIKHSPTGFVLSKVPEAASAAGAAIDSRLVTAAPRAASAIQRVRAGAAAGNPRVVSLLARITAGAGTPGAPPVGSVSTGTLAGAQ